MPPGTEQVIESAAQSGWIAILLVMIVLGAMTLLGWLVRLSISTSEKRETATLEQAVGRETTMRLKIDSLDEFIRNSMMRAIQENTQAMLTMSIASGEATKVMSELLSNMNTTRPCLMSAEARDAIVSRLAEAVVERIENRMNVKQVGQV